MIGCPNIGCCYGPIGGVSKCKNCTEEYKKFLEEKNGTS